MEAQKYAIPQAPRCAIKQDKKFRHPRNDWCEKGGDCSSCSLPASYEEYLEARA